VTTFNDVLSAVTSPIHAACGLILTIAVLSPCNVLAAQESVPQLFSLEQTASKTAMSANSNPYVKHLVDDATVQEVTLGRSHAQFLLDEQEWLDVPLEQGVTARIKKMHFSEESGMGVWTGEVQSTTLTQRRANRGADLSREVAIDPQNLAILVHHGDKITGTITLDGKRYEIDPIDNGRVAISQVDESDTSNMHDDSVATAPAELVTPVGSTNDLGKKTQQAFRVLTVYSNDVEKLYADPVARGVTNFEFFKEIARASGVTATYENAGVVHIAYDESAFPGCDEIQCLGLQYTEVRKNSREVQQQYKAHSVVGMVAKAITGRGCGYGGGSASIETSVAFACAHQPNIYAHEFAHTLDAHHSGVSKPRPYSNAYCQNQVAPYWQTLMAYCEVGGKQIALFSNPDITYEGFQIGVVGKIDNARAISEASQRMLSFFPDPDPTAAPIASGFVELGQQDMPFSGEAATLNGNASRNPGVDAMRYEWTQTGGVPAVTIDRSQSAVATAHFPEVQIPTDYRFRLTVANASGHVDATEVTTRVYPRAVGEACGGAAAWEPDHIYSVPGQQVSYQGDIYRLIRATDAQLQRAPPAWSGMAAPMNWTFIKACDAPRTLQQRLAVVDDWATANRNTQVTFGLQQQLRNLLTQQQFTWPQRQAAGRLRPIMGESKQCVVKHTTHANQLMLSERCDTEDAVRWLLDGSGRLHAMGNPELCVVSNGDNQAVTLQPCADNSTVWVRFKDRITDYQSNAGLSLVGNYTGNARSSYGNFLAADGNYQVITKTKTLTSSGVVYSVFGDVQHDYGALLAHAKAQTLTVIGHVLDSDGQEGDAPAYPPMIEIVGPTQASANEQVVLDAGQSGSINPGAQPLTYTWEAPPATGAEINGQRLRFTAPSVSTATPYTFKLRIDDGQAQAQGQHVVTVSSQGHVAPEGDLTVPPEVMEKTPATFIANVRSSGGLSLTYLWDKPAGFSGTAGNTASVTLTAPAVTSDQVIPITVHVRDSEGGTLDLNKTIIVKKNTQMTGGVIVGKTRVESEEIFTQHVEIANPLNRPLTYNWVITQPIGGELSVIGSKTEREIKLKAPLLYINRNGHVLVRVSDGETNVSLPNKSIGINKVTLAPLTGRMILANEVNVGDIFEPKVILDNSQGRDISYTWWVNAAAFELLTDPSEPNARVKAIKSSNSGLVVQAQITDGTGNLLTLNDPRVSVSEPKGQNPPVGDISGPPEVISGALVTYNANYTSPVGNPLTYAWVKGPLIGAVTNSATQTWTAPAVTTDQVVTVRITVSDNAGNISQKAIPVLIKKPDEAAPVPPTVVIRGPASAVAGAPVELDGSESGSHNSGASDLKYRWTLPAGIDAAPVDQARLTFNAPLATSTTNYRISLEVDDGKARATQEHILEVTAAQPPRGQILGAGTVESGSAIELRTDATSVPPGDTLNYVWSRPSGFTGETGNVASVSLTAPSVDTATPATVQLTVTGSNRLPLVMNKAVMVEPVIALPVARISGPGEVQLGYPVILSALNSTGSSLAYNWTAPNFTPTSSNIIGPTFNAGQVGTFTISLTVKDSKNRTASAQHTVKVNAIVHRPPVGTLTVADTVDSGKPISFTADASSPSGRPLTYNWTRPEGFTGTVGNTTVITLTAPAVQRDTDATVRLIVADDRGGALPFQQKITIKAPNSVSDCAPPWVATKVYASNNEKVSYDGYNYEVAHWTQNQRPDVNWVVSGSAKPWRRLATCTP